MVLNLPIFLDQQLITHLGVTLLGPPRASYLFSPWGLLNRGKALYLGRNRRKNNSFY